MSFVVVSLSVDVAWERELVWWTSQSALVTSFGLIVGDAAFIEADVGFDMEKRGKGCNANET